MSDKGSTREILKIVIAGHVDHGKSTIVGRLLADSGALPDGKLAQVKAYCERNAKPFEYAFLIDALKSEKTQGVTIDAARVFFRNGTREYILIDAPGHIEFVKNLVTGASRADGALLVVDAEEGIQENSRRHATLLGLLGVKQVVVLVNKMDLVSFRKDAFDGIKGEYSEFLGRSGIQPMHFIPVSGVQGENVVAQGGSMPWYSGCTVLDCLASFKQNPVLLDQRFRMWVQDVYKFTNDGDARRIVAGTIEAGSLRVGDQVLFYPSGKKSSVKTIEGFQVEPRSIAEAGQATGITLTEQVYVSRGELASRIDQPRPLVTSRLRVSLFWLGKEPMQSGKQYTIKIGTAQTACLLETVRSVQDAATLSMREGVEIGRHEIADCDLVLSNAVAFDLADEIPATGRFVIVDQYEIRGGGIIREALEDKQSWVREKVLLRDSKWETSAISAEERAARFRQKPALVIVTGEKNSGKKPLARSLEAQLVSDGHLAYFLGIGNVLYGVDADIKGKGGSRREHMRRLAEVAHILLETGLLLIVTAIELSQEELEIIKTTIKPEQIVIVWKAKSKVGELSPDLELVGAHDLQAEVDRLKMVLEERGIIQKQ